MSGPFGELSFSGTKKQKKMLVRSCLDCGCLIRIHGGKLRCIPCAEDRRMAAENKRRVARRRERAEVG